MKSRQLDPWIGVFAHLTAILVWWVLAAPAVVPDHFVSPAVAGKPYSITMFLGIVVWALPFLFCSYRIHVHLGVAFDLPSGCRDSEDAVAKRARPRRLSWLRRGLVSVPIMAVVATSLTWLFLAASRQAYEAPIRLAERGCRSRMMTLADLVRRFHEEHGYLPAAIVADRETSFPGTWRAIVLSQLKPDYFATPREEQRYAICRDFARSGKDCTAEERTLIEEQGAECFVCPADPDGVEKRSTHYVAVVGPETFWPGTTRRRILDITEEIEDKILLVELPTSDIRWTEPRDISFDEALDMFRAFRQTDRSRHPPTSRSTPGMHYVTFGGDDGWFTGIASVEQFADMLRLPEGSYSDELPPAR